jgi:hypothetical protein
VAMLAKNFGRLMKNNKFKKYALGIFGLTVGISSRVKGRLTMQLSVMSKKKKKLLLKIRNF